MVTVKGSSEINVHIRYDFHFKFCMSLQICPITTMLMLIWPKLCTVPECLTHSDLLISRPALRDVELSKKVSKKLNSFQSNPFRSGLILLPNILGLCQKDPIDKNGPKT